MRVVVVGGGPAGLAAAYALKKCGASPIVMEQWDRIGGRSYTQHRDGFVIDLGAQFLSTRYRATLALCQELGLTDQLARFKLAVGIIRDGEIRTGLQFLSWPNRFSFLYLVAWLILYHRRLDAARPEASLTLNTLSVTDFALGRYNREFLENWFQPFISGATSAMPEDVTASCALTYMWYNMAPSLTFKQGVAALVHSLSDRLPEVRLNTQVTRIILEDNRLRGIQFRNGNKLESMEAEMVVVATPAPVAAALLPDLASPLRAILLSVPYTSCLHIVYGLRQKSLPTLYGVALPRHLGLRVALLTEDANKCVDYIPNGGGILHAVTYESRSWDLWDQPDSTIEEAISAEICQVLPDFPPRPLFTMVHRWSRNMCVIRPGHVQAMMAFQQEAAKVEGLAFAGDYLTVPCLEGAVLSGQWAAARLAGRLRGRTG